MIILFLQHFFFLLFTVSGIFAKHESAARGQEVIYFHICKNEASDAGVCVGRRRVIVSVCDVAPGVTRADGRQVPGNGSWPARRQKAWTGAWTGAWCTKKTRQEWGGRPRRCLGGWADNNNDKKKHYLRRSAGLMSVLSILRCNLCSVQQILYCTNTQWGYSDAHWYTGLCCCFDPSLFDLFIFYKLDIRIFIITLTIL